MKLRSTAPALGLCLWIAVASEPQSPALPETVAIRSGELTLRGLLWRPSGPGPFPAVLFNHGSGRADYSHKAAALGSAFARHGYVFLYLYRRGAGLSADQGVNSAELMARAQAATGQEGRNATQMQVLETELDDVRDGMAFLAARRDVDARRLAVAGHSFGGSLALLLAEHNAGVRAAVVFGAAAGSWDASPQLRARLLAAVGGAVAPVYFAYAANDFSVAPATALSAEMTRLGKPHRVRIYPAIGQTSTEGHDFYYGGLSTWQPDVFAFLTEAMRP